MPRQRGPQKVRPGNVRVSLSIDAALHRELKILAAKQGRHMSDIVADVIEKVVEREKKKEKEEGG